MPKKLEIVPPSTELRNDGRMLVPVEHRDWRSELTAELIDELVAAGMTGAMKTDVALSCAVPPELFEAWLDEGMRYDSPALMRELAVRFLGSRKAVMVALADRVVNAALAGDNKLALELLERHNAKWSKDADHAERENAPPELPLDVRHRLLVEGLRKPRGDLRRAMLEAGIMPPDAIPETPPQPTAEE